MSCVVEKWPVGGELEHGMHEMLKMAIDDDPRMSPKWSLMIVIHQHYGNEMILIQFEGSQRSGGFLTNLSPTVSTKYPTPCMPPSLSGRS